MFHSICARDSEENTHVEIKRLPPGWWPSKLVLQPRLLSPALDWQSQLTSSTFTWKLMDTSDSSVLSWTNYSHFLSKQSLLKSPSVLKFNFHKVTLKVPEFFFLLRQGSCNIKLTIYHFKVHNLTALSTCTMMCNQHFYLVPRQMIHLKRKTHTH